MTDQYLTDFANHWLTFLNSLQWQATDNLSDTIDQLTLLADSHQSPLIALFNAVNQQSLTGQDDDNLANSLIKSAKSLFSTTDQQNAANQVVQTPLLTSFAPLLALMDGDNHQQAVSLTSYLTRLTRVRLKLQQIINSADPQAMAQELAQSLFAGKTIDFADTQEYSHLLTASLGQNLQHFGNTLFIQPMEQAWQQLLTPASQSLNHQWQQSIVNDWQQTFAGRYPFNISQSDASLPLLAQFLQADSGKIERFIQQHLAGLLSKEGGVWQVNQTSSQGLTFNPAFIEALNTLSHISQVAFTQGEARLYFELRPGTDRQVMQTTLIVDHQPVIYDNQLPFWQRLVWPNDSLATGATLSWLSQQAGSRIYADYPDSWGWIRLLADAQITPYAGQNNSYLLTWPTADGGKLNYTLRTEYAEGPLVMLQLRHFVLPDRIFATDSDHH